MSDRVLTIRGRTVWGVGEATVGKRRELASVKPPKVSVIMPVYNVDQFLMRAVESIQSQTFDDFELIAVDDGSTDRSGSILDNLASRDFRIEVIHIPNGGAAAARNLALDRAKGTYVYFMDSDDWCESHMLEDMVGVMERDDLELLVAGFYIDTYFGDGPEHSSETKSFPTMTFATQQDFRLNAYQLFDRNLLYTPWNKLFLRSRIEDLHVRFRNTFMDDFPFVLDYIRDVERVGVIEQAYYHFTRARSESETSRWRPDLYQKREEEHTWMLDLYKHWELDGDPASMEMVQRRYIERLVGCIENVCDPACKMTNKQKTSLISEMISTDRAQVAVEVARPRTQMMRMMLVPIRNKDANLAFSEGCFISFVRRHNTRIFATLKANR